MINLPTLYNKDNIMVAVDDNNHIAGITVSCQSPFCEKIDYIKQAYERAGEKMDEHSNYIFDNYYALVGKAEDGYYIANVSVDSVMRLLSAIHPTPVSFGLSNFPNFCTE